MSRCRACDCILNEYELTRKSAVTGEYYDLCGTCFATIKDAVHYKERIDLMHEEDVHDDEDMY